MSTTSRTTAATSHAAVLQLLILPWLRHLQTARLSLRPRSRHSSMLPLQATQAHQGQEDSALVDGIQAALNENNDDAAGTCTSIIALELGASRRLTWGTHMIVECSSDTVGLLAQLFSRLWTRFAVGQRAYELSTTPQQVSRPPTPQKTHGRTVMEKANSCQLLLSSCAHNSPPQYMSPLLLSISSSSRPCSSCLGLEPVDLELRLHTAESERS
ncbi:hypothetical protein BDV97DRAFT_7 [Delphinella strobiligena]|nr:hypothetical protein BDV97DRAFT_7 [Delphinella strobiligena]